MSIIYNINNTEGTIQFVVKPGTLDWPGNPNPSEANTDLKIYGNGSLLWGEGISENLYRLTENFACEEKTLTPGTPQDQTDLGTGNGINKPVTGQLWFNKTTSVLNIYLGGGTWEPIATGTSLSNNYYTKTQSDARYLELSGDTMSGQLDMNNNNIVNVPTPTNSNEATPKGYVDTEITNAIGALTAVAAPPGLGPVPWAGSAAPTGWLLCDGSLYDPATYPQLFAVIGTTYGGNGITTFAVPDARGRFILGLNNTGSGIDRVNRPENQILGGIGGSETVTLTVNEIPAHNHTGTTNTAGSHGHTGTAASSGSHNHSGSTNTTGNHQHTAGIVSGNTESGSGDAEVANGLTGVAGNHSHTLTINSNGTHTHTLSINSSGSHSHTLNINNTGGGAAHENTPPFITMNYIIKHD